MNTSALRDRIVSLITRFLSFIFPTTRLPERTTFESIFILKPCCLGDVLLATPVIAALRRAYPQAQIDFGTGTWSRPAVANNPNLGRVMDTGNVGQGVYG